MRFLVPQSNNRLDSPGLARKRLPMLNRRMRNPSNRFMNFCSAIGFRRLLHLRGTFGKLKLAAATVTAIAALLHPGSVAGQVTPVPVEAQPLAANVTRLVEALDVMGASLPPEVKQSIAEAARKPDADRLQQLLDEHALFVVELNPESRVKARRGPAKAVLQQGGYTPVIVKVVNLSTVTKELRLTSPQAGQVFAGMTPLSAKRMQRESLRETETKTAGTNAFLDVALFARPPMTPHLSGLEVEYALALIHSRDAGKREATIAFDVGGATQDLGFRAEVPVLFDIQPAVRVKLRVRDHDGSPATASFIFRDAAGHVHPPQAKRLAPDFYFQPQVYRSDGDIVLLPPGRLTVESVRGPEYRRQRREETIPRTAKAELSFQLERWIDPAGSGFYSGDHHIHGAGCAHYTSPTEGVMPEDMFKQVEGEGLNVGCVLTWGPCFDYQRKFFAPGVSRLSKPLTVMKYDLEISGFGSDALGHVCLLNLKDQTYPGSEGLKTKGWPSWTLPVMRWAKEQGGFTGYAHSASGLEIHTQSAVKRLLQKHDADGDVRLTAAETTAALLPFAFGDIDDDRDSVLTEAELAAAHERAAGELPNFAVPPMNGVGAMEIGVTVAHGVCDFISAMDTPRIAEWNMWYHLMNCGFPLKVSGETDFPCMSGERVGQGRVYVQLGRQKRLDFAAWCDGLARGRSYVSDGFAHALAFKVNGTAPGFGEVSLDTPGDVSIEAQVAFAAETPALVAHGFALPPDGKHWSGDTVTLHGSRTDAMSNGGERVVEIVVNGRAVASARVPADGKVHPLRFRVPIQRSSWVALRQFPQLHTNPVNVQVGQEPLRASRRSALWCIETIERLREQRRNSIREPERGDAMQAYDEAVAKFRRLAAEAPEGS
ncbi:MAG: hypothetical protein FJ405_02285 [Verrucomicrobia bacterium]|nr:hypothetical protein [Verrucomicrobiota bacterium]